ncbi:MAG: nuclear transport factor 2 family protein [Acidimicrobiales bacterium]
MCVAKPSTPADHLAIERVLLRYCRAIDRCDAELLRSCYHDDAHDHHGPYRGDRDGFVDYAIGDLRARAESHGQLTTHLLSNILVDIDGDVADAESYFRASHVEDREDHFRVFEFNGRYIDRFERRDGEWRIASRVVVHDWSEIRSNRRGLRPGTHDYAQGSLAPADPLYG